MVHTEDVTARRRAERQLTELNATLEQRVAEQTAALLARSRDLEAVEARLRRSERHYREIADHNRRLARELEHRVGNHLTGLLALVREMRQRGVDVTHFSRAIEDRLVALAHVHRLLALEGWRPVRLGGLVRSVLAALQPAAPRTCATRIEGADTVAVDSVQATALAMILTEWFTNSCKYGVHSAPGGRLEILWSIATEPGVAGAGGPVADSPAGEPAAGKATSSATSRVRLTWTERGGPPIRRPVVASLGTELVHGFAARELRGRCEMTYPDTGAAHALEFAAGSPPPPAPARTVGGPDDER
jgi:two-component sensor histidine kinase